MTASRIYVVTRKGDKGPSTATHRLIRASTGAQAIRHAVGTDYEAEVADQGALVKHVSAGVAVEDAGELSEPPKS